MRSDALTPTVGMVALAAAVAMPAAGCDLDYPEVVVVNRTNEDILLRDPSFNGCRWNTVLAYDETTTPGRCLPGEDKVHFEKFDAAAWAEEPEDPPTWFAYQTVSVHEVDYGDFVLIEITLDDVEQDFSVPGPYGH